MCHIQLGNVIVQPSWLKIHDWLCVLGPLMKYIFQVSQYTCVHTHTHTHMILTFVHPPTCLKGCLQDARAEKAVFDYIDLLQSLWRHTFIREEAASLPQRIMDALAEIELLFPAWDATINRHNVTCTLPRPSAVLAHAM